MGFLSNIFATKEKLWEGANVKEYNYYCEELKKAGIWTSVFKVNQQTPKCSGDCGSCHSSCDFDENTPFYEKIGMGFTDDLLKPVPETELYAIYVKRSDLEAAKRFLK